MTLLDALKQYKYDTDDTYKNIAMECNIPFTTFYNFTSGLRDLKPRYKDALTKFLEEKGYLENK